MERTLSSGLTVGLADQSLKQLLPHLFSAVAARGRKRTVCASLENRKLVTDIKAHSGSSAGISAALGSASGV